MTVLVAMNAGVLIGLIWYVAGWGVAAAVLVPSLLTIIMGLYQFWRIAELDHANALYQLRLQLAAERARPGWRFPGDQVSARDGLTEIGAGMFGAERQELDWQGRGRGGQPPDQWAEPGR